MIVQNVVVSKEVCVTLGAPIARLGVNGEGEGEEEVWIGGDLAAKGFDDTEGSEIRWSSCPLLDPDFEIYCTSTGSDRHTQLFARKAREIWHGQCLVRGLHVDAVMLEPAEAENGLAPVKVEKMGRKGNESDLGGNGLD